MAFIFSTTVSDASWAGHAFRIKNEDMTEEAIMRRRYYTTSSKSFLDTSWGGHFAVNPLPQFTRNCDLHHGSIYTGSHYQVGGTKDQGGLGRWYSEVLNDNQQEIHIRAGVVRFNSMMTFFTNFYSVEASILSRRGRATSFFYSLGKAAGYVGSLLLQPFILGAEAINFFLSTPRTKFYYLSPAMHMYWRAVSTMMNTYMVNVGLTEYFDSTESPGDGPGVKKEYYDEVVGTYHSLAKEGKDLKELQFNSSYGGKIFLKNGGIDVFAISTRAQRLGIAYRKNVNAAMEAEFGNNKFFSSKKENAAKLDSFIEKRLDSIIRELPSGTGLIQGALTSMGTADDKEKSYLDLYTEYQMSAVGPDGKAKEASGLLNKDDSMPAAEQSRSDAYPSSIRHVDKDSPFGKAFNQEVKEEEKEGEDGSSADADSNKSAEDKKEEKKEEPAVPDVPGLERADGEDDRTVEEDVDDESILKKAFNYFKEMGQSARGNMEMGSEFVTFRINNTGSQSESFTNTSGDSGLHETINSNSSAARSARFNFAGGNIGGPIGYIIEAVEETVAGVLDSMKLGGIMALGGSAFIDIQKVYQNSSADMMATSITIPLRAWSADPWTIAKDIAYPLFCILALGMPKSTGSRSYDEPFLIELFLRGRSQIREGRVRSISITRGVGDIAWTKEGHPLGIDVTVDFEDMSGVVGVPINPSTSRLMAVGAGAVGGLANSIFGEGASNTVDQFAAAFSQSTYSEDNKFGDYMNVLGAVDLHRQINTFQKWRMRMAQSRVQMEQWRSPHSFMSMMSDTLPGRLVQAIGRPTDRN